MKRSLRSFFLLLFVAAVFTSCEQCGNVTISEPTPEDAAWLVYRENDTIRFETEAGNDTVIYTRSGIFAQNLPGEDYSPDDECIESINMQIRTVMDDLDEEQPALGTRITSFPDSLLVELSVANQGFWEINEGQPTFPTLPVNGREYINVYEVITNTTTADGVKRILYNQQYGFLLVEFNDARKLELRPE